MDSSGATSLAAGAHSRSTQASSHGLLLCWLLLHALCWTAFAAATYASPPGDNIEQLDWAHSLEWGYWKHPPLPTWLMHVALGLGLDPIVSTYALGHLCTGIGLWFAFLVTRRLVDERTALCSVLLGSAIYYFSARGHFFNHNSALLPWVGLMAWTCLRLLEHGRWRHFAVLGLSIGAGTLVKYQMLLFVVVPVVLWALHPMPANGLRRRSLPGALLAGAVATSIVAPHVVWAHLHHWPTIGYASSSLGADLDGLKRLKVLLGFVGQQFTRMLPMLVAWGVASILAKLPAAHVRAVASAPARRIAAGMALAPAAGLVALALLMGVRLQNHWGTTVALLFIPAIAVGLARHRQRPHAVAVVSGVLVAHALAAGSLLLRVDHAKAEERYTAYPSQALADQALAWWHRVSGAEAPAVLLGPAWDAGVISARMPHRPPVLPDNEPAHAPWVRREQIERGGALLLSLPGSSNARLPWGLASCIAARGTVSAPYAHGTATVAMTLEVAAILPGGCRD